MVKMATAAPIAAVIVTSTLHAIIDAKLSPDVSTRLVPVENESNLKDDTSFLRVQNFEWLKCSYILLTAGNRAKASTDVERRAKPSKAVGRREARQTAANRPALRESALSRPSS